MSKTKKILKIVRNILLVIAALIVILIVWGLCDYYDQPEVFFRTVSAEVAAKNYYYKKYGERLSITDTEPQFSGGFLFDSGRLVGIRVYSGDTFVYVTDEYIVDNRQYEDIYAAFYDKYITDERLGSEVETEMFSIDMGYSDGYKDALSLTDVYFDGDIDNFLKESGAEVKLWADYSGYPEKGSEYPDLLDQKLDELEKAVPWGINVSITVADPTLDLPEMEHKFESGYIHHIPKYEGYMELIACCEMSNNVRKIYQPSFFDIDEYTAVSVNNVALHIKSAENIVFEEVEFPDDTVVHRGVYKYDSHAEEEQLTVRNKGYRISPPDSREDYMIRLDRKHYGIDENTVPLMITDIMEQGDWQGKRLYVSLGYCPPVDADGDCWYYLDNDYLYLYIDPLLTDLWLIGDERYLAFADL